VRILVRAPSAEDVASWRELNWRAEPDPARLAEEHAQFRGLLAGAGAELIEARGEPGNLDSIYVYDPVLVTPQGAILLQPGKAGRRGEPEALAGDLPLPVVGRLEDDELAEGGDTVWLDETTLLVGQTYRTNEAASRRCAASFPAWTCSRSTCRTFTAPPRCSTSARC
jgi:N-dimethylarginine dimethylaminohydrolase